MNEVKVGDQSYRIGKLDAMKQFHVTRRILPFFTEIAKATTDIPDFSAMSEEDRNIEFFKALAGPLSTALSAMKDEDSEYIIYTCLGAVSRQQGQTWAPVVARGHSLMFEDIDLATMLRLTSEVVQENLSGFFRTALPKSDGAGA